MESVITSSRTLSVTPDIVFPQKMKRKRKKSKRLKAENEQLSELESYGLDSAGLHYESKPECKILYKKITDEFRTWLKWQRMILLCGLTAKCSKSLLRTMGTVIEPVLHKSFKDEIVFYINIPDQDTSQISRKPSPSSTRDSINAHEPFLPHIEPSKVSIVQTSAENSVKMRHKHCNKDEINSAPSKQFFHDTMISKSRGLGKICVSKKMLNFQAINKNYTSHVFKNRKWWSSSATSSSILVPNGRRLLENFKIYLDRIYKWFSKWTDAEQGACILEILAVCQVEEVEYLSQCILQRLKDRTDINRIPDHLMKNIFHRLPVNDLLSAGLVCKRWHSLAEDQQLWKDKCHALGMANGMRNIVKEIERAAAGHVIDWKSSYRDLVIKIRERNERNQESNLLEKDLNSTQEYDYTESPYSFAGSQISLTSPSGDGMDIAVDRTPSEEDAASVVSGMSDYVNGDLGMIEDSVQELKEHARREDSAKQDDVAFDIRPEVSIQAENKLANTCEMERLFRFVSIDKVKMLKRVRKLQGHLDAVLALQFDKKRVVTGSVDRTAILWDVRSGRSIHKFEGHKGGVRALCFDKEYIITGSWDTTIIIWNAVKFTTIKILDEHKDCVSCLGMNDEFLVSGSHDKTIRIWSKHTWSCTKVLTGHTGCVTCLCIVDNQRILTAGMDRLAKLWNIANGSCLRSYSGSSDMILTIKSYGDLVAAGSYDGDLLFWDMKTGNCEGIIMAHTGPLHCISFHGARFVTGGGDQLIKEWDLSTCSCIRSLTGHKNAVLCVQMSAKRVVSGSADGTFRIWDMCNRLQQ